ncbi:MAG: 6-phosphogluconolactonase [Chloroflexota bacterium]
MTQIRIFPDSTALSTAAAALFMAAAKTAVSQNGRFLVALSGGSTPLALFQQLRQPAYAQIPWQQTHVFWGDERLVPPTDPGSNYGQAYDALLRHVPIPAAHIHRAKGELEAAAAVADYAAQLRAMAEDDSPFPRFDLAIMGMGDDGHTASLFPGPIPSAENTQPVMAVTAFYETRPAHRLTLTPQVFNDARQVIFLVTGAQKAAAVTAVLHGTHDPEKWPAQRIQPRQGQLIWFLDEAASGNAGGKRQTA